MPKFIKYLRSNIITGVLIMLPLVTTLYVFIKLFGLVDSFLPSLFHAILPRIPNEWVPGVGLLVIVVMAYFVGLAAKNYFGNKLIQIGNAIVSNIPFVNKIYVGVQQILDAAVTHNKALFKRPVIIQYPKENCYSIAFVTSRTTGEVPEKLGRELLSLFVPTTPNPTSGYLLFLPESEVVDLDMSVETAIKLVMSAGMVNSDQLKKTQHLYAIPKSLKNWNWLLNLRRRRTSDVVDPRD